MNAEEILYKHIKWIFASEKDKQSFIDAMNEYADSLARERAVEFIMNELGRALTKDVAEVLYDTFLAEKTKEEEK